MLTEYFRRCYKHAALHHQLSYANAAQKGGFTALICAGNNREPAVFDLHRL